MNNPGIDLENWERLRKKWSELQARGRKLRIEFRLIASKKDENDIIAIDVVQNVDNEIFTETVQRKAGEAYTTLGIAGLSMESLVAAYKTLLSQLARENKKQDANLIVTMAPSSPSSGEIRCYLEIGNSDVQGDILVNYRHYYVLSALREKMLEILGDGWKKVKAVYRSGDLEFYFEY